MTKEDEKLNSTFMKLLDTATITFYPDLKKMDMVIGSIVHHFRLDLNESQHNTSEASDSDYLPDQSDSETQSSSDISDDSDSYSEMCEGSSDEDDE